MSYTFQFHPLKVSDTNSARDFNLKVISGCVIGAGCMYVGLFSNWDFFSDMKDIFSSQLSIGQKLGVVEQYDNGYSNIFVKQGKHSVGIFKLWMSKDE